MPFVLKMFLPLGAFAQAADPSFVAFNTNLLTLVLLGTLTALAITLLLLKTGLAASASVLKGKAVRRIQFEKGSFKDQAQQLGESLRSSAHTIGLLMCVMVTISLFLGTYLAGLYVTLVSWPSLIALGLFIWAAYSLTAGYFRRKLFSDSLDPVAKWTKSLSGAGFHTVQAGLQSTSKKQARTLSKAIMKDFKKEFKGVYANSRFSQQLDRLIDVMNEGDSNSQQFLTNLVEVLNHTEIRLVPTEREHEEKVVVNTDLKAVHFADSPPKTRVAELSPRPSVAQTRSESIAHLSPSAIERDSAATIQTLFDRVKELLRSTGNNELEPQTLKEDFQFLLEHPRQTRDVISQKLKELDREDFVRAIIENTELDRETVEGNLTKIQDFFQHSQESVKKEFQNRFEKLKGTALDPEQIQDDFDQIIEHPSQTFSIISDRLGHIHRDDLRTLLVTQTRFSENDIDRFLAQYDRYQSKLTQTKDRSLEAIKDAKAAVSQFADDASAAGISLLWWRSVAAAVGAAAAIGGVVVAAL